MSAEILARHWQRMEDYYRDLQSSLDAPTGPAHRFENMRAFVERIVPAAIAENIDPGHAHACLILTKGMFVRVRRSVYLLCNEQGSRFAISWRKDNRQVLFTIKAMDSARWQRIVNWLNVRDQTK